MRYREAGSRHENKKSIYCMYMQHSMNVQYKWSRVDAMTFCNIPDKHY